MPLIAYIQYLTCIRASSMCSNSNLCLDSPKQMDYEQLLFQCNFFHMNGNFTQDYLMFQKLSQVKEIVKNKIFTLNKNGGKRKIGSNKKGKWETYQIMALLIDSLFLVQKSLRVYTTKTEPPTPSQNGRRRNANVRHSNICIEPSPNSWDK